MTDKGKTEIPGAEATELRSAQWQVGGRCWGRVLPAVLAAPACSTKRWICIAG